MGNFICNICSRNEENYDDDNDYKNQTFLKARSSIINNPRLSVNNPPGMIPNFQFLDNNYFEKSPFEEYEIIKNLTQTKCQVIKKQDKGMKLFEKLLIMESFEQYSKNNKRIMNDIFKLNNKGIVKVNCIYKFSSKLFIIYENIENNLLKEEKIDININYRKEIIENLFNIIKNIHDNNIYNIGLNLDTIILQKKTKKKILKKKSNKDKELNKNKNDNITYSISVLIINILQPNFSQKSTQFYSPEIIEQIFKNKIYIKDIYTKNKNDEWSCGIFLYYLITGEFPYKEDDVYNINLDLSSNKFNNSNEQEKDLLLKLLEKNENKRISIQECLEHPFIKENIENINIEEKGDNIDNIIEEPVIIKKKDNNENKIEVKSELKEDNKDKINEENKEKENEKKIEGEKKEEEKQVIDKKDDIKEKEIEEKEEKKEKEEIEIKELKDNTLEEKREKENEEHAINEERKEEKKEEKFETIEEIKENNEDSEIKEEKKDEIKENEIKEKIIKETKEKEIKGENKEIEKVKDEEKDIDTKEDKDINDNVENDITEKEDIDYDLLKKLLYIEKPINKLQEMALTYLSYHFISEEEKSKINKLFDLLDRNKDSIIEKEDIIYAFNKNKIEFTTEQINQMLSVFDYDLNLRINNLDFIRYLCNKEELFTEENLKKLFDDINTNKNDYINEEDIFNFITDESLINIVFDKNFLEESGIKDSDIITFDEFSNLIQKK